ncbi:MAG TPA: hypothetical protein VID68_06555 [Solirubrobacteraceae bacterium]
MRVHDLAVWAALAVAGVNGLTGLFGAFRWYVGEPSRVFWVALRIGQGLALGYAVLVGALVIANRHPASNLFYVYALVPTVVGFVAEQLRVVAADHVLGARDLDGAADVAALPQAEQQAIVLTILRREMGIMALAALVVFVLALRAAGTY